MKIAHFGPPGLLSDALQVCLGAVGHSLLGSRLGSGPKPNPEDLMAADVVILWVAPQPPGLEILDEMHAILVLLGEAEWQGEPKRIILLSNLLTWGSSPQLGNASGLNLSEDDT